MFKRKNKLGFSLLELSLILMVIAILTVILIKGRYLVNKSMISSAQSLTASSPIKKTEDLVLWIEPTSIKSFKDYDEVEDEMEISDWFDISSQSQYLNFATQPGQSQMPKYEEGSINGIPAMKFDGNDGMDVLTKMEATGEERKDYIGNVANGNHTIFLTIYMPESVSSSNTILSWRHNSGQDVGNFFINSGGELQYDNHSAGVITLDDLSHGQKIIGNKIIMTLRTDYESKIIDYRKNGAYIASKSFSGFPSSPAESFHIGREYNGSQEANFYNGYIGELAIYNRLLSAKEQKDIEAYLLKKWKINKGIDNEIETPTPPPPPPQEECHGASIYDPITYGSWSAQNAAHGGNVVATCTYGGSGILTCNNGNWSGGQSCKLASCSNASSYSPITHGSWTSENADDGSNISATCTYSGSGTLTCSNGNWSGGNSCGLASCSNASSYSPITHGSWTSENADDGSNISATCTYSGSGTLTCSNGNWSGGNSCGLEPCSDPSSFQALTNGGNWSSESTNDGSSVTPVNCDYGLGTGSLACNNGNWSGSGSCPEAASCTQEDKPPLSYGSWNGTGRPHGGSRNGTCFYESSGGTPKITCNNGSWIRSGGNCRAPASCNSGKPFLPNGSWPSRSKPHGRSLDGICPYESSGGTPRITCNNGSWNRSGGNCKSQPLCLAYTGPRVYSNSGKKYKIYKVTSDAAFGECRTMWKYSSKKGKWKDSYYNKCCGSQSSPKWKYGNAEKGSKSCPSC